MVSSQGVDGQPWFVVLVAYCQVRQSQLSLRSWRSSTARRGPGQGTVALRASVPSM